MDLHMINLDRDVTRRAWMERQFRQHGLTVRRFAGVLGSALTPAQRAYHAHARRAHLSAPEIGCLLSHIGVWELIAAGSAEHAAVFEDDVHLADDFASFIAQLRLDPDELCVHRLETFRARVTLARQPAFKLGHRTACRLDTNHGGAAAYVLNRKTAAHLLDFRPAFRHLPDVELFDPDRRVVRGLTTYQWSPAPCIQDFLHVGAPTRQGFDSNLDHDRSDRRAGLLRKPPKLVRGLQSMLRPLYTAAYSAALAPQGRKRVDVRFG